ncbi:MAG: class I SAM-dependent methyltransferase [Verrucomicrobiia bacterium]|jgi:hypothetical protein
MNTSQSDSAIKRADEKHDLEQHPLARLIIPPMAEGQHRAFLDDIRANGLIDRRVVLHENKVLRGWATYRACIELEIQPEFEQFTGADPLAFVISSDLHRRHLDDPQREALAAAVLEEWCPQYRTDAEKRLHLSQGRGKKKVASDGAGFSATGKASKQVAATFNVSTRQVERAIKLKKEDPARFEQVRCGGITVTEALNDIVNERKFATLGQLQQLWTPNDKTQFQDRCQIRCGDFVRFLEEPPLPYDHIVTDLPYDEASLPMYGKLAEIAARKLPAHGMLVCMVGHYYLPEILETMCRHVRYRWTAAYIQSGAGNATVRGGAQANAFWKPILIFGSTACGVINCDKVVAEPADDFWTSQHPFPADPHAFTELLRYLQIPPGAVVADPCMGTAVTGVACLRRNIRFIGADIEQSYVALARLRIGQEWDRIRGGVG